jgi:ABC-2 type transport system ATP-binding protein
VHQLPRSNHVEQPSAALAFVNDSDIGFLEEPPTGLDRQAHGVMWEVIKTFRSTGKTIFLTTHYMEKAEQLCDTVAIIDHRQIIAMQSPQKMNEEYIEATEKR